VNCKQEAEGSFKIVVIDRNEKVAERSGPGHPSPEFRRRQNLKGWQPIPSDGTAFA
jgi:hypothetical protein